MSRKEKILVLDDEPDMAENIAAILKGAGYEAIVETESSRAVQIVGQEHPDLIVTDLRMPGMDGLAFLEEVKAAYPEISIIMLTAFATVETAVEAIKKGASDYLSKPFSQDEVLLRIRKALDWNRMAEQNRYLRERMEEGDQYGDLVGESESFREVRRLVDKIAATDTRVLVLGESGTGKEIIARTIHRRSLRRGAPFVAVNCAALTETLIESELFGHERGAFTGAVTTKKGIFEVVEGGTLFLDEVSETSLSFQAKLLRVVEEGEFLRVGGTRPLKADVRIISSSNRDLREAVASGRFREDLFYRLSVFEIRLPPLRERGEDIPLLAHHFLSVHCREIKKKVRGISVSAMEALKRYPWPGNIRELQNVIERAVIMAEEGKEILPEDLPGDLLRGQREISDLTEKVHEAERELILRTLRECNWNRSLAAERLGIGRRTLYDKLARLGIPLQPVP